jgi:hypothetical protein
LFDFLQKKVTFPANYVVNSGWPIVIWRISLSDGERLGCQMGQLILHFIVIWHEYPHKGEDFTITVFSN